MHLFILTSNKTTKHIEPIEVHSVLKFYQYQLIIDVPDYMIGDYLLKLKFFKIFF
jgi:hypothetical protein